MDADIQAARVLQTTPAEAAEELAIWEEIFGRIDYGLMPKHIRGGMRQYIEYGTPTDGFLNAVLDNDLLEAFNHAVEENTRRMKEIVAFVYNDMPRATRDKEWPVWIKHLRIQSGLEGKS